jgi:hypothetical protein
LCRPPAPASETGDEAALNQLADKVAERIVSSFTEAPEREPERRSGGGFDGGARQTVPPPPEDHGAWLARVIRERRADAGARF